MADYRVIQHVNSVLCDRLQEICDSLELNWVGIHKDLDTQPKDDEEATIYCSMYRVDDIDDIGLPAFAVRPYVKGPQPADPKRQDLSQIPPRFMYLYFIVFVESPEPDLSNTLLGAVMNGFHQEATLIYQPKSFELNGRLYDSMGRPLKSDGLDLELDGGADPQASANKKIVMERISVQLVDDLAFGDACLLLKGFERKIRPYLTYRVFAKIDQPLNIVPRVGRVGVSLFDADTSMGR